MASARHSGRRNTRWLRSAPHNWLGHITAASAAAGTGLVGPPARAASVPAAAFRAWRPQQGGEDNGPSGSAMGELRSPRFSRSKPSPADKTRTNRPFVAFGDVNAARAGLLHPRLGLRNRLHDRSAPPTDDQPGGHPTRVAVPAGPGQPRPVRDPTRLSALARQSEGGDHSGHRFGIRSARRWTSGRRSPGSPSFSARGPPWPSGGCRR